MTSQWRIKWQIVHIGQNNIDRFWRKVCFYTVEVMYHEMRVRGCESELWPMPWYHLCTETVKPWKPSVRIINNQNVYAGDQFIIPFIILKTDMLRTLCYEACMVLYTGTEWCCEIWKCICQKTLRIYMNKDTQLTTFQAHKFFPRFFFVPFYIFC